MINVWEHGDIGPRFVHNHGEVLKHGVNGLTEQMSEVLILHPLIRKQASLHLIVPTISYLELLPNLTSQILCTHSIKFRLAKRAKKIIDRLVVRVVHISERTDLATREGSEWETMKISPKEN
jgi:hypothetical protein